MVTSHVLYSLWTLYCFLCVFSFKQVHCWKVQFSKIPEPNFPWKFFWLFVTLILTEQTPAALVRWQAPMTNDWLAHFQSRLYLRMRRNFTKRAVGIKPEAVWMCSRTVCLQDLNGWYKTSVVLTGEETAFVCLVLHIMQILLSWSYLSE